MKKIFIALIMAICASSFSETLVYSSLTSARMYQMNSQGNTFKTRVYRAYLVVGYDSATETFSEPTIVRYWIENGQKLTKTINFAGSFTQNAMNSPQGNRVFMDLFQDGTDKNYEFNESPASMGKGKFGSASYFFFASGISGSQITESTSPLGERTLQSCDVKYGISNGLTKDNIGSTVAATVSLIETMVQGWGYKTVP